MLLAALIEAPIALLSDGTQRLRTLGLALVGLSGSLALCAIAVSPWQLSIGLALAGGASGVACAAAQGAMIAAQPGRSEQAMSRWAAFAAAGDLLGPLTLAIVAALGGSYRAAFGALAVLLALQALRTLRTRQTSVLEDAAAEEPEAREPLRAALGRRRLWLFLLAAAACTLLDEIAAAIVALRLARDLGASAAVIAVCLTVFSIGELCGAVLTERVVARVKLRGVLLGSAAACVAALLLAVHASDAVQMGAAVFLLGLGAAPHYPLAKAAAYDAAPGRPGLVNAASQLFVIFDILLPLVVGAVATRAGLANALLLLGLQPLAMVLLALLPAAARQRAAAAREE